MSFLLTSPGRSIADFCNRLCAEFLQKVKLSQAHPRKVHCLSNRTACDPVLTSLAVAWLKGSVLERPGQFRKRAFYSPLTKQTRTSEGHAVRVHFLNNWSLTLKSHNFLCLQGADKLHAI